MSKAVRFVVSPFNALLGNKATAAALAIASAIPGPHQPFAMAASAAFGVYQQLTAPKPIARGSPAQLTIDVEPPRPYAVGQVMVGGVLRHDVAYGPTLKKVPNPYRWQVRVLSGVGPINGFLGDYFDFEPIGAYYSAGFLNTVRQNGNRPEASALLPAIPGASGAPGWNATSKLSGCAAVGLNLLFDREGERYASGIPIWTALIEGERVYDPRLDSTFPGGSGSCRAGVESTYVYSRNPACHAVTYALGRFQNGIRIYGLGQPVDTLDMPAVVDWANTCDANGWTVNMLLQEGGTGANLREQRVRNLDDLCAAGGGRWYQAGGLLSFDWHRPRLSLATLTDDDILEAGGGTDAVPTVRNRMNGVRPQYVSPDHNWQQITAAEIVGSTYRTEDGEKLTQVYPLNGVTNPEQAGELASYAMADSREIGPMDVQAKAKWRFYRPGDTITINSSLIAYNGQAVINQRALNPATLAVSLSLKSETPGKHDFALGKVAAPPPTPILAQTPEERDTLAAAALAPRGEDVGDLIAPANSNRVPLSRMEGDSGWSVTTTSPGGVSASYFSFENRRAVSATATATVAAQFTTIIAGPGGQGIFPLVPDERLSVSVRVGDAANISGFTVNLGYTRADGSYNEISVFSAPAQSWLDAPLQGFVDVPSDARLGTIRVYAFAAASGSYTLVLSEPMVTSAAAEQTVQPPFSAGPVLTGPLLAGGPLFVGQLPAPRVEYGTGDTVEDLKPAEPGSDVTATAQRTIEPQFPVIEIKQGEAGHTGNRTVTHAAKRGTATLTGGTWSLPIVNLGAGSATINASTGTVTLSGIVQSGAYSIRYVHTDGLPTDLPVNVSYIPTPTGGVASARVGYTENTNGVPNDDNWNAILSLTVNSVPTGRVSFSGSGSSRLSPSIGTGDADYEARLRLDGTTTLKSIASQNVVSGGVTNFTDFSELFDGSYAVAGGNRTVTIELRRTNGTGRLTSSFTALEATFIAS